MKGVVLAGGAGSRLRPITFAMSKQLVPVANQPILFYGLYDLAEAGITDVAIIISPETGQEVPDAVGAGPRSGIKPHFILQGEGGTGKTVSVLRFWEKLLKEADIGETVPIYVALHEYNRKAGLKNFIEEYMMKC